MAEQGRRLTEVERDGPFETYTTLATNAQHNRDQAVRLFEAGWNARQIAETFPRVFYSSVEAGDERPTLGQWYHRILSDGRGECDLMILSEVVDDLLATPED